MTELDGRRRSVKEGGKTTYANTIHGIFGPLILATGELDDPT